MKGKLTTLFATGLVLLTLAQRSTVFAAGENTGAPVPPSKAAGQTTPATHGPEQLGDFMLPEVTVKELPLNAALGKLKAAYEDTCRKTGETPLNLTFDFAPGEHGMLNVKLPATDLQNSILLLACLSGMKAERKGLEYQFEPLTGEEKVTKILRVPPDFASYVNQMAIAPSPPGKRRAIAALLAEIGVIADPGAPISLGSSGELTMTNIRAADAAALSDFTRTLASQRPKQLKFTVKVLELSKDAGVTVPKTNPMTSEQAQGFQKRVSEKKGVNLSTLPTVTARIGQAATIENVRDFPPDVKTTGHQTGGALSGATVGAEIPQPGQIGRVVEVEGNLTGLKLDVKFHYTEKTGSIDPPAKEAKIATHAEIAETGFFTDGTTKLLTQTRPDGSKTVLLVKAELIDATGRPYRDNR